MLFREGELCVGTVLSLAAGTDGLPPKVTLDCRRYCVTDGDGSTHARAQASCESGLCTSVDWSHPGVGPGTLLATATSDGELVVLDAATPGALAPLVTVTSAHDLEIWTVAFDRCVSLRCRSLACVSNRSSRLAPHTGTNPPISHV